MAKRIDSFRTDWSNERLKSGRTEFHAEQLIYRKHGCEASEQEDDWFFNAPGGKEEEEEAETV